MRISVIGIGFVGLVTGACLSEWGHQVVCMDTDDRKVSLLSKGQMPFFEVGLKELVRKNVAEGRLSFTTDMGEAVGGAETVFLCVGTPAMPDGGSDISMLVAAAESIGTHVTGPLVVVQKSTAPVGTTRFLEHAIAGKLASRGLSVAYDVVSNPEFLREGSAVHDFLSPDRVVVGGSNPKAVRKIGDLYAHVTPSDRFYLMDSASAELTKYAANGFLATKISFINEIANMCEALGADTDQVRMAIGADPRIGPHFLYPGIGYGGSCFPKDVKSLIHAGSLAGYTPLILKATDSVNTMQRLRLVHRISEVLVGDKDANLSDFQVAVWGLSFKPGTDDMREAPSLTIIRELRNRDAKVRVYDPVVHSSARPVLGCDVDWAQDMYTCVDAVDAVVLLTEWEEFRRADLQEVRKRMRGTHIFDGRNALDPSGAAQAGFDYYGVGRLIPKEKQQSSTL